MAKIRGALASYLERDSAFWTDSVIPFMDFFAHHYCRLTIAGLENVPPKTPHVFVSNHGGWFTLDSVFIGYCLAKRVGVERLPVSFAADALLKLPFFGPFLKRIGAIPVSLLHQLEKLKGNRVSWGMMPEGSSGNCKPFTQAYQVREFRPGFVRLALFMGMNILPISTVGAEECLPVLHGLKLLKPLIKTHVPIPLSLLPLPVSWRLHFHKPFSLKKYSRRNAEDADLCRKIAGEVRAIVQRGVDRELELRREKNEKTGEGLLEVLFEKLKTPFHPKGFSPFI